MPRVSPAILAAAINTACPGYRAQASLGSVSVGVEGRSEPIAYALPLPDGTVEVWRAGHHHQPTCYAGLDAAVAAVRALINPQQQLHV